MGALAPARAIDGAEAAGDTPDHGEQDGEPAQLPRRKIGERQQSLLPCTLGQQESGEEPGDPDGDDRDEQLHDRDPPQAVPLPEREEDRERREREHEDPAEIEARPTPRRKARALNVSPSAGASRLAVVPERVKCRGARRPTR